MAPKHPPFVPQPGLQKHRELRFNETPPGQSERASALLAALEGMQVAPGPDANSLCISYEVTHYTFHGLERALEAQGFHLDNSLYMKFVRALLHFCESTQLRNLRQPERLIKNSHQVYVQAWEQHAHGDHDETPPELREYK
ncbi:MAG: hypothetical protein KF778_11335 [Rhodocyclaceae bacterium]|nr:hypothetical protein [Rhodocyclaceae bacterium]MBX3668987.1 hypothetical protein [Rhodocyclaceae bacterium]